MTGSEFFIFIIYIYILRVKIKSNLNYNQRNMSQQIYIIISDYKKQQSLLSYSPIPPLRQDMTQGQYFKWSLTGLNLELPFS